MADTSALFDYVNEHIRRLGDDETPPENTMDLIFWRVVPAGGAARTLVQLIREHKAVNSPCNLFDGQWHNHIDIGGFVGHDGLALAMMALGASLDVFELEVPESDERPREEKQGVTSFAQRVSDDMLARARAGGIKVRMTEKWANP